MQTELNNKALSSTVTALQTTVSGKQNTIGDNGLSISKISGLQTELNNRALSTTVTALQTTVNGKQNTIGDNGLSISHISGLQTELNNKALSTTVTALQTTVSGKQNTIGDNGLAISKISGLQTELNYKQDKLNAGDKSISVSSISCVALTINGVDIEDSITASNTSITSINQSLTTLSNNISFIQTQNETYVFCARLNTTAAVVYPTNQVNLFNRTIKFNRVEFCYPDRAHFNTSTFRYIVPVRGIYRFYVYLYINTPRSGTFHSTLYIMKNDGFAVAGTDGYTFRNNVVECIAEFQVGDEVFVNMQSFSGTTTISQNVETTQFTGYCIRVLEGVV